MDLRCQLRPQGHRVRFVALDEDQNFRRHLHRIETHAYYSALGGKAAVRTLLKVNARKTTAIGSFQRRTTI